MTAPAAIRAALDAGDTDYPFAGAYATAFAGFAERRWGWAVDVEATASVPDVLRGLVELLQVLTDPGDAVVLTNPVYPPFYAFVRGAGRRIVEAPLTEGCRLDLDSLRAAFVQARAGGGRAVLLLSNPHNPSGTVHTREELTAVAALAAEHGVRVIADEIHAPVVLPGAAFTPYLTVPGGEDGFSLVSASKGWNLNGLKAAIALAGPAAVDELRRMPPEVSMGASHLGDIAHAAAFEHGEPWLDALLAGLDLNRHHLARRVAEHLPGVGLRLPEATIVSWLDFRAVLPGVDDVAAVLLEHGRVALNPGTDFGTGGAGHARLNYATSTEILDEAVDRIAAALARA